MRLFGKRNTEERDPLPLVQVKGSMSWGGGRGYNAGDDFIRDVGGSSYTLPYLPVRENDARNSSIVAAVASWAMRNVVQPNPVVQQENGDGEYETVNKHLAASIIRKPQGLIAPDQRTSLNYKRMLRVIAWSLIFDGNAYLMKVRNGRRVIGLDWYPHTVVRPIERPRYPSIIDGYEVHTHDGIKRLPREDFVHISQGVDPAHPAMGCSALKSVMRLVMTDNQIAIFSHAVLRNPFPGLVITPGDKDSRLMPDDLALVLEQMRNVSAGERGGGIAAFTDFMKVEKVGYSPDDMAVRELAKLPEERISAVFGIPAIVCGLGAGLERSTFANFEQAREAATEEFLVPLWDDISDAFTEQFLPEFEKNTDSFRVFLDYSNVKALQEDVDALHDRVREDFKDNVIDRATAKIKIGEVPGAEDVGVYAYQLRPAAPETDPKLAQGKAVSKSKRQAAEDAA